MPKGSLRRCATRGFATFLFACFSMAPPAFGQTGGAQSVEDRLEEARSRLTGRLDQLGEDLCLKLLPDELKERLACAPGGSNSGVARGDFNGDGFADLAVGMPEEDTPEDQPSSGAVVVIYGSASGLTATNTAVPASQFWSQNTPGVPESSENGDGFGAALAAGNFNADNFSDLAIGIPFEDASGNTDVGSIVVIYGSATGLSVNAAEAPQLFNLFTNLSGEKWGFALAWGDFNGDDVGDLAVGGPGFTRTLSLQQIPNAGAIQVLFGSAADGLRLNGRQFFDQDSDGVFELAQENDFFGRALAAGDFNGDDVSDLAIGVPGEDIDSSGFQNQGAVAVFLGRAGQGVDAVNDRFLLITTARPAGIPGPAANDQFGIALASGDFNNDNTSDLVIGVPDKAVASGNAAGGVYVFGGSTTSDPLGGGVQYWDQNRIFGSGNENGDKFGHALAAGDFDNDGRADLAIGSPFEDVGNINNAGAVYALYGSAAGLSTTGRTPQSWHQNVANVEGTATAGDMFGFSLSAWNFGRNDTRLLPPDNITVQVPFADLAIGVPFEDVGSTVDAGGVNVLYGTAAGGISSANDQLLTQSTPGVPGGVETGDSFGKSLY